MSKGNKRHSAKYGAADRTRMKKEAAKERQREQVRRVLSQESE